MELHGRWHWNLTVNNTIFVDETHQLWKKIKWLHWRGIRDLSDGILLASWDETEAPSKAKLFGCVAVWNTECSQQLEWTKDYHFLAGLDESSWWGSNSGQKRSPSHGQELHSERQQAQRTCILRISILSLPICQSPALPQCWQGLSSALLTVKFSHIFWEWAQWVLYRKPQLVSESTSL